MVDAPLIVLIAGPNGAGKSTFARQVLANEYALPFINADMIARYMTDDDPQDVAITAGRETLALVEGCIADGAGFVLETTLSGQGHLRRFARAIAEGWVLHLHYIWLRTPDLAVGRVRERVALGGHSIPEAAVLRRYRRGLDLLPRFVALAERWYLYDNSEDRPQIIASGTSETKYVERPEQFALIAQDHEDEWLKLS